MNDEVKAAIERLAIEFDHPDDLPFDQMKGSEVRIFRRQEMMDMKLLYDYVKEQTK